MFKYLDDEGEEGLPWCLRGYPLKCSSEEIVDALIFLDADNADQFLDIIHVLTEICQDCQRRLEYEGLHGDFTS